MIRLNIKRFASGEILLSLQHSSSSVTFQGKVVWSSTVVSGTNTSNVTAKLYARKQGSSSATSGSKWTGYVTINGTRKDYSTGSLSVSNDWKLIYTAPTVLVTHNSDGSKSITIAGSVKGPSGTSLANITSSGSDTAVLDTIHRQSSLSSVAISITTDNGGNSTVTVTPQGTKYVDGYYDSLTLSANNQNIALDGITFGTAKTLTDAQKTILWNMFGDNRSVVISAYITTKTGPSGTTVGYSSTITTTANLPEYTINVTGFTMTNDAASSTYINHKLLDNDIIAGVSIPTFTFSGYSSNHTWYGQDPTFSISVGGDVLYTDVTSPLTLTADDTVGFTSPLTCTITHKGETQSNNYNGTIIPYEKPALNGIPSASRTSPTSQTINIVFGFRYYDGNGLTDLPSDITITATYQVGNNTPVSIPQSSLTRTSHTITDHIVYDRYSCTVNTGSALDYQYPTKITFAMTDLIGYQTQIYPITIPQGNPLWYGYADTSRKQYMVVNGALNVKNDLSATGDATFDDNVFANTFEFGNIKNHLLPDGDLLSGSYWCSVPNGHYWLGTGGSYTNAPVSWGFVDKTGFYITDGTIQDYNVVIYSSGDGPVYRLNNNTTSTNTWRRIDGGATEMTLGLTSNQAVSATGAVKITLSSSTVIGTGLSVSSNGIKIGPGIKYVEVSGQAQLSAASGTGLRRLQINKNFTSASSQGTAVVQSAFRPTGSYETVAIVPKLISVAENDVLYLILNSDSNSQTVYGSAASTYLTVKVVR